MSLPGEAHKAQGKEGAGTQIMPTYLHAASYHLGIGSKLEAVGVGRKLAAGGKISSKGKSMMATKVGWGMRPILLYSRVLTRVPWETLA